MATTIIDRTLLALLLSLKDLETPLSETEKSQLSLVAEQLSANPAAWDVLIEPRLLAIIQANAPLNQLFQNAKSLLDNLGDDIPQNLLPTEAELEEVAPSPNTQPLTRAALQVRPSDLKSNEITNMAIRVIDTPNPAETAKKLSGLEQFKNS